MGFLDTLVADAREALGNFTAPRVGALPDQPQPAFKDPHFFFGQPVTTGPYPLVVGTPQQISDPNVATAKRSRYVQIQNATGCVLNVQTGVGYFTIQALAASTVPTDYGMPVILNPTSGYTNFSQYVQIVWLLDGQTSPMADGSINAPYIPGTPLSPVQTISFTTGTGGPTQLLPAPAAGFVYQLFSISFAYVNGGNYMYFNPFSVEDTTTSTTLYTSPAPTGALGAGGFPTETYSLSGTPQQTGAIALNYTVVAIGGAVNIAVTLNYFNVPTT